MRLVKDNAGGSAARVGVRGGPAAARPVVIFTADDFGRSSAINRAVLRAHGEGVLTAASLMVGAPAACEAIEMARAQPSLAVGLHLVISDGAPVLPPDRVERLVDGSGRFDRDPLRAGLRYGLDRAARRQLRAELRAQFERFASTGLPLDHVDGHMQMHVHPAVFPEVARLAVEFGAGGIRLPRDSWLGAMRGGWKDVLPRLGRVGVLGTLSSLWLRRVRAGGLGVTERVFGIARSGEMDAGYVCRVLGGLDVSSAELIFHPTEGPRLEPLGPNPGDLATLLSPAVRSAMERIGLCQGTYRLLDCGKRA